MNSLKVPDSGLVLNGAPDGEPAVPPQAFVVDLDDSVVDQMIQSARNGQDMHLSLGQNPVRMPFLALLARRALLVADPIPPRRRCTMAAGRTALPRPPTTRPLTSS